MRVKNIYQGKFSEESAHNGVGITKVYRPFSTFDFNCLCNFVDYAVICPYSSIGLHSHGNNEEIYFVLKGSGLMSVNGEKRTVVQGDVILNPPFGEHGIVNDSDMELHLLVLEIECSSK